MTATSSLATLVSTSLSSYIYSANSLTGICSTIPGHDRICVPGPGRTPSDLAKKLSLPLDVIKHVLALQSFVSFALPAISGILILGGHVAFLVALFSTGEKSEKSRRRWIAITRIILWSAVVAAFAAAYLLNFSVSAMKEVVPKSSAGLAVTRGRSLQVLQWMVFSFTALYVGMVLHILHKIVKETREGILPTSTDAEIQTAAPSAATQTESPAENQTSSGTQSDSLATHVADLLKLLAKISTPKKPVQDSEA